MKIVYIYRAVRQELSTPETGPYITFGILALRLEAGQWQKVCPTADVSTSRSFAADLADRCTADLVDAMGGDNAMPCRSASQATAGWGRHDPPCAGRGKSHPRLRENKIDLAPF